MSLLFWQVTRRTWLFSWKILAANCANDANGPQRIPALHKSSGPFASFVQFAAISPDRHTRQFSHRWNSLSRPPPADTESAGLCWYQILQLYRPNNLVARPAWQVFPPVQAPARAFGTNPPSSNPALGLA